MATSLGDVLAGLPEFLGIIQIVVFIGFILTFGSIAVLGFRYYTNWMIRLGVRFGIGTLALIAGIAMAPFLPFFKGGIYDLMYLDILAGGAIASVIFGVSLFLITYGGINAAKIEKTIASLQRKLHDARSRKPSQEQKIIRVAGIVVIAALLVFSVITFPGFPDINQKIAGVLGIDEDQFNNLISGLGQLSPECRDVATIITRHQDEIATNVVFYENEALRQQLETETGSTVSQLFSVELEGTVIVLAVAENGQNCVATETEVCICGSL